MARVPNQSLAGLVARITNESVAPTLPWLLLVLPVLALALWRARHLFQRGNDLAGFTVIGLAAALASPISWTHHLVWIIPALAVLVSASISYSGFRRYLLCGVAIGTYVLFATQFTIRYGDHVSASQLAVPHIWLTANAYLLAMLLLVALLPGEWAPARPLMEGELHTFAPNFRRAAVTGSLDPWRSGSDQIRDPTSSRASGR